MDLLKAPHKLETSSIERPALFLAGSIEQGKAEDWQKELVEELADFDGTIFSPRRDNWDTSWPNTPEHPGFHEQVSWELEHIERADLVLFYFQADTLSPISLLELGYVLGQTDYKMRDPIIVCPREFWRHGNVYITAERAGVQVYESFEEAMPVLRQELIRIQNSWIKNS